MIVSNIEKYFKGWFVGDFENSIYRTNLFEVAHHKHPKNDPTFSHYHKLTTELNYIVRGELNVSGLHLKTGDMWIYEANEISNVTFLEDTELIVVRWPSIPTYKYDATNRT